MTNGVWKSGWTTEHLARLALIAGAAGAVVSAVGALLDSGQFFRSYLFAYIFWLCIPVGSLAFLMLHFIVGGGWGLMIRRLLETATRTLPLLALMFVPLLFGLHCGLSLGRRPEHMAARPHVASEIGLPQRPFLHSQDHRLPVAVGRISVFLKPLVAAARWIRGTAGRKTHAPAQRPGAFGLPFHNELRLGGLDHVHRTALVFGRLWRYLDHQSGSRQRWPLPSSVLTWLGAREPLARRLRPSHFHDLGNLLLAFIMLWAYMAFSQYLIIWSANLAEEIPWYIARNQGAWRWLPPLLIVFHFFVPFFLLLMRDVKRNSSVLVWVATGILVMRLVDTYWMIVPGFENSAVHWLDASLMVGIGGLWLGVFLHQLNRCRSYRRMRN